MANESVISASCMKRYLDVPLQQLRGHFLQHHPFLRGVNCELILAWFSLLSIMNEKKKVTAACGITRPRSPPNETVLLRADQPTSVNAADDDRNNINGLVIQRFQ
jgi:hypothetical protein